MGIKLGKYISQKLNPFGLCEINIDWFPWQPIMHFFKNGMCPYKITYCSFTVSWLKESVRWILPLHQIREHGV